VNAEEVEPAASPLGRFDSDLADGLYEVRLLNVPLRILAASREHYDEVMREFAMLALDERLHTDHAPARLIELVDILGRRYGAASARPDAEIDDALACGATAIDLLYHVPDHMADAAEQLESLMRETDEFCQQQQMLALARPELFVRFSEWYLDQFRRQLSGEPPRPWDGPLEP
jgi:hypothetical protein